MESISVTEYRKLLGEAQPSGRRKARKFGVDGTPLEETDQRVLAEYLDALNLDWFHVPNGGARCAAEGGKLKAQGVKKGVPDVFICNPPPNAPEYIGTIIELKRKNGGVVSLEQKRWLMILKAQGWLTKVCHGADEAIAFVEQLGYVRQPVNVEGQNG